MVRVEMRRQLFLLLDREGRGGDRREQDERCEDDNAEEARGHELLRDGWTAEV
jgi:hypothetical protein